MQNLTTQHHDDSNVPFFTNLFPGDSSVSEGSFTYTNPELEVPHGTGSFVGFEDEPPLLEELGIDLTHIRRKTLAVISCTKIDPEIAGDRDLAGPLLFCIALGALLLLTGKLHFGYVFGFGSFACLAIYILLNLMSESGIDCYKTASVLGYCLLPMILLALVSVVISMNSTTGYIMAALTIGWCTHSAALMFVTVLDLTEKRILIAYPLAMVYTCFALITMF